MNRLVWIATSLFSATVLAACGASPDAATETVGGDGAATEETPGAPDTGAAPTDDTAKPPVEDTATTPGSDAPSTIDTAVPGTDTGAVGDTATPPVDTGVVAPTFTELYNTLFHNSAFPSNCSGSFCHDPGKAKGLDFSSKAVGYNTIKTKLVVGDPAASLVVQKLVSGVMPKGRAKWSTANVDKVRAWIAAGAKND